MSDNTKNIPTRATQNPVKLVWRSDLVWDLAFLFEVIRGAVYQHHALSIGALLDNMNYGAPMVPTLIVGGAQRAQNALEALTIAIYGEDAAGTSFPYVMPERDGECVSFTSSTGNTTLTLDTRKDDAGKMTLTLERRAAPSTARPDGHMFPPARFIDAPTLDTLATLVKAHNGRRSMIATITRRHPMLESLEIALDVLKPAFEAGRLTLDLCQR